MALTVKIEYQSKKFSDVWANYSAFSTDYASFMPLIAGSTTPLTSDNIQATYYLLYARYANSPILGYDEMQWKMKVFSNILAYGPTWEKKKTVQVNLRGLTESDILQGAKQIYNHAFNPSTTPTTSQLDELTHINEQNVTNNKKAKMEAYAILWSNLHVDATDEYINKFKNCFSKFVGYQFPLVFVTEEEE